MPRDELDGVIDWAIVRPLWFDPNYIVHAPLSLSAPDQTRCNPGYPIRDIGWHLRWLPPSAVTCLGCIAEGA